MAARTMMAGVWRRAARPWSCARRGLATRAPATPTALIDRALAAFPDMDPRWARRLTAAAETEPDAPLRVLVVSPPHVARNALVNALLGYPDGRAALPEQWGAERTAEVVRISKGATWAEEVHAGVRRVELPHIPDHVELTVAPPFTETGGTHPASPESMTTLASRADVILLVTDPATHLASAAERAFLKQHARNRAVVVALNNIDHLPHEGDDTAAVLAAMQDLGVQVWPVSSRRAGVAAYLKQPDENSGVPELRRALLDEHIPKRAQRKHESVLATLADALDDLRAHDQVRDLARANLQEKLDTLLKPPSLPPADVGTAAAAFSKVANTIRDSFAETPYWRLPVTTRCPLTHALTQSTRDLVEAEMHAAYETGRLAQAVSATWHNVEQQLQVAHSEASADTHAQLAVDRARENLPTPQIDPYIMSNVVWTYRTRISDGEDPMQRARALVATQAGTQVVLAGVLGGLGVAGWVDAPLAVTAWTAAAALGVYGMKVGWTNVEHRAVERVEQLRTRCVRDLKHRHAEVIDRHVTEPMATMRDAVDRALGEQAVVHAARRAEIDHLSGLVEALRASGGASTEAVMDKPDVSTPPDEVSPSTAKSAE